VTKAFQTIEDLRNTVLREAFFERVDFAFHQRSEIFRTGLLPAAAGVWFG
jgi:hypothetical protein